MFELHSKIPRQVAVAVSGGVDSVAILDFLSRSHEVTILHFNHNEGNSDEAEAFVYDLSKKYACKFITSRNSCQKPTRESREEFWRNQRYEFFHSYNDLVITGHTLDDCVETWLVSAIKGNAKVIPYANRNVIRPFLLNKKEKFLSWANRHDLSWIEDESNLDLSLERNYVRKHLIAPALHINPGLYKTVYKKVKECRLNM